MTVLDANNNNETKNKNSENVHMLDTKIVHPLTEELNSLLIDMICDTDLSESLRLQPLITELDQWRSYMEDNIFNCINLSEDGKAYCLGTSGIKVWTEHAQTYMTAFNRDFRSQYDSAKPGHNVIQKRNKIVISGAQTIASFLGVEININADLDADGVYVGDASGERIHKIYQEEDAQ